MAEKRDREGRWREKHKKTLPELPQTAQSLETISNDDPEQIHIKSPRTSLCKGFALCALTLVAGAGFEPTTFGLWVRVYDYFKLWWFRPISSNWRFAGKHCSQFMLILCRLWENSALLVPWGEKIARTAPPKIWNLTMLSPKPFSNNPMVVGFNHRKTSAILIPLGNKLQKHISYFLLLYFWIDEIINFRCVFIL